MAENFFGLTDTGKVRKKNEDTFIAQKAMNNKFIIACAIDGVGGYSGGEVAAGIAKESILDYFESPTKDMSHMIRGALIHANEKIHTERLQVKKHAEMACVLTLAVVDIENNQFYYAHVGDTRLYLLRDNTLVKVSKDHSFVGFLEDSGRLSEASAMSHPKRNEINKALGFGTQIESEPEYIQTGQSPFLPKDILLLCSDGLTDMVNHGDITSILLQKGSLEDKATKLVAVANDNGGKDNITVVLVQNNKAPLTHEATKPISSAKKQPAERAEVVYPERQEKIVEEDTPVRRRGGISSTIILTTLCVLFLASSLYLLSENLNARQDSNKAMVPVQKVKNSEETALQHAIDTLTKDTLLLSDAAFPQTIIITDTLHIRRDSLYILTKGNVTLESDSSYTGPAFILSSQCKYIVLDSLTFSNFGVGVTAQSNALFLKNVRFNNCRIPVQNLFLFAQNQYVSGRIPDAPFLTDSVPIIFSNIIWMKPYLR